MQETARAPARAGGLLMPNVAELYWDIYWDLHELAFFYPGTHRHVLRYRRFLWACGMPPDPMAETYRGPSW